MYKTQKVNKNKIKKLKYNKKLTLFKFKSRCVHECDLDQLNLDLDKAYIELLCYKFDRLYLD